MRGNPEREYQPNSIERLHLLIDSLLRVNNPDLPTPQFDLRDKADCRRQQQNLQSQCAIEEKIKSIKQLAESILNSCQLKVSPDDTFLGQIASYAIEYTRPHWHEGVDTGQMVRHQTDWSKVIDERIKVAITDLEKRQETT